MSTVTCYAHLPRVGIKGATEIPLGTGRIERVPLEKWVQDLDPFADRMDIPYKDGKPVFFVMDVDETILPQGAASSYQVLDIADWDSPVRDHFEATVNSLYDAFLLISHLSTPDPMLSVRYYLQPDVGVVQVPGRADRDLLFDTRPRRLVLSSDDEKLLGRLEGMLKVLEQSRDVYTLPEVQWTLWAARLSSFPGSTRVDSLVHNVIALENLLLPEVQSGHLAETFANRPVPLMAKTFDDQEQYSKNLAAAYKLRSAILHGEYSTAGDKKLDEHTSEGSEWLRNQLLSLLFVILRLGRAESDPKTFLPRLRSELDEARTDETAFNRLDTRVSGSLVFPGF